MTQGPAQRPVRVLVVDDHADVRFLVRVILERRGPGRRVRRRGLRRRGGRRRRWTSSSPTWWCSTPGCPGRRLRGRGDAARPPARPADPALLGDRRRRDPRERPRPRGSRPACPRTTSSRSPAWRWSSRTRRRRRPRSAGPRRQPGLQRPRDLLERDHARAGARPRRRPSARPSRRSGSEPSSASSGASSRTSPESAASSRTGITPWPRAADSTASRWAMPGVAPVGPRRPRTTASPGSAGRSPRRPAGPAGPAGSVTGSASMMSATVTPSRREVTAVWSTALRADCHSR